MSEKDMKASEILEEKTSSCEAATVTPSSSISKDDAAFIRDLDYFHNAPLTKKLEALLKKAGYSAAMATVVISASSAGMVKDAYDPTTLPNFLQQAHLGVVGQYSFIAVGGLMVALYFSPAKKGISKKFLGDAYEIIEEIAQSKKDLIQTLPSELNLNADARKRFMEDRLHERQMRSHRKLLQTVASSLLSEEKDFEEKLNAKLNEEENKLLAQKMMGHFSEWRIENKKNMPDRATELYKEASRKEKCPLFKLEKDTLLTLKKHLSGIKLEKALQHTLLIQATARFIIQEHKKDLLESTGGNEKKLAEETLENHLAYLKTEAEKDFISIVGENNKAAVAYFNKSIEDSKKIELEAIEALEEKTKNKKFMLDRIAERAAFDQAIFLRHQEQIKLERYGNRIGMLALMANSGKRFSGMFSLLAAAGSVFAVTGSLVAAGLAAICMLFFDVVQTKQGLGSVAVFCNKYNKKYQKHWGQTLAINLAFIGLAVTVGIFGEFFIDILGINALIQFLHLTLIASVIASNPVLLALAAAVILTAAVLYLHKLYNLCKGNPDGKWFKHEDTLLKILSAPAALLTILLPGGFIAAYNTGVKFAAWLFGLVASAAMAIVESTLLGASIINWFRSKSEKSNLSTLTKVLFYLVAIPLLLLACFLGYAFLARNKFSDATQSNTSKVDAGYFDFSLSFLNKGSFNIIGLIIAPASYALLLSVLFLKGLYNLFKQCITKDPVKYELKRLEKQSPLSKNGLFKETKIEPPTKSTFASMDPNFALSLS